MEQVGGQREMSFRCHRCIAPSEEFGYVCMQCAGPLLAELESLRDPPESERGIGMWRWRQVLPRTGPLITLGEGGTPLVPFTASDEGQTIHLKMESLNPTLSFKDRAMALAVSWALAAGSRGLVVASTGNAAVSASAYASAAGLQCRVFVGSESRAVGKMRACRDLGAEVDEVHGDYSAAYARAADAESSGWLNVSTTYRNPILAEAYRAIAFELLTDLGQSPGTVVVPIGAGPLLRGIGKGFDDAVATGLIDIPPRLIGVQAARVAPIVRAWRARSGSDGVPLTQGPTVATAIADALRGYESHGQITLEAIAATDGHAVAVSEGAILTAQQELHRAGVWVEPSAATALAGLDQLVSPGEGPTVLVLTGHGAKAQSDPGPRDATGD